MEEEKYWKKKWNILVEESERERERKWTEPELEGILYEKYFIQQSIFSNNFIYQY